MKYDKFFEIAKAKGISECEVNVSTDTSLSISLFHGEVDNYSQNSSSNFLFRGIYNDKMGAVVSDVYSSAIAESLVDKIIASAKVIENDDPVFIFKGSEKYKKINTFNKELPNVSIDTKMDNLYKLEKLVKEGDPRITEVAGVEYAESTTSNTIINSHGLKLTQKNNYFLYYAGAVSKENGQTKTGGDIFFDNDFSKFDVEKFAKQVVSEAVAQLNGEACTSGKYKAVLDADVVNSLLGAYIGNAVAEDVQKNSSLFIGKLGQKVASRLVTVYDKPHVKNVFARYFDDEGVATVNKPIIKNGVLQTYLYNLTTAKKDGVESTGNGSVGGSKVSTCTFYIEMKPGKKTKEELFQTIGNGVYITEVQGLHAGLNPRSGNFSLQSSGFLIENGKKGRPLDIITVSGNLVDLFNSITAVGSDAQEYLSAKKVPSVIVKSLTVSGK